MSGPPVARERRVEVGGREVRLLSGGRGPAVVLVHGLGLSADAWTPHMERLAAAGYHVVAPDLPGFGGSPGPWKGLSVSDAARWLHRLACTLGLDRCAWVGHSLSTQQLIRLAASRPGRVGALVLAAPVGRPGYHPLRQAVGLIRDIRRERPGIVAGVARSYLRAPLATLATWVRGQAHDATLDAPRVRCPALLVLGDRDPVVEDAFGRRLARLLPDGRIARIEGGAHALALDPPGAFTRLVLRFLERRYRGVRTPSWKSAGIASKFHGSSDR